MLLKKLFLNGDKYGQLQLDKRSKVNVESVSANSTGELHLGHAEEPHMEMLFCRILEKQASQFVNIMLMMQAFKFDNLAKSLYARYATLLGKETAVPEDGYHSE